MKKLLLSFSFLLSLICAVNAQSGVPGFGMGVPSNPPFSLSQLVSPGSGDVATTGLSIALGLRRLVSTYTGPLVQVVRASDSSTLNIPQDATGNLDQAMCAAFQGSSTLAVSVWYDQTVNGNNAVQTTSADRPTLVCSVPQLAGLPAISWGTTGCGATVLEVPTSPSWNGFSSGANPGTILDTEYMAATNAGCTIRRWEVGNTDPNALHALIPGGTSTVRFAPGFTADGNFITSQSVGVTAANVLDIQYQWTATTNVPTITINGSPATLATNTAPTGTAGSDTNQGLHIGNAATGNSLSFPGYMTSFLLWKSGPGATQLELARKNEGNYYGISVQ